MSGIDRTIEDHRRDPDPHPRWRKQIDAALTPDGETPNIPVAGTSTPKTVELGLDAAVGTRDGYAKEDHRHKLVLPPALEHMAEIAGPGVVQADTNSALTAVQKEANRVGVWDAEGLTARDGFTATEDLVTVPSLRASDQAGTGERLVLADADGDQRAEAKAQWIIGPPLSGDLSHVLTVIANFGTTTLRALEPAWSDIPTWVPGEVTLTYVGFGDLFSGYYHWRYYSNDGTTVRSVDLAYNPDTVDGNIQVNTLRASEYPGGSTCWISFYDTGEPFGTYNNPYTNSTIIGTSSWPSSVSMVAGEISPGDETLDVLELGPDANLRVLDHAGTGQRMLTAKADGTHTVVAEVVWDGTDVTIRDRKVVTEYLHTQGSASAAWTIDHNLGRKPSVDVIDSGGTVWMCEVQHTNDNSCVVRFGYAFSGTARLR